jgi:hypothetical protein
MRGLIWSCGLFLSLVASASAQNDAKPADSQKSTDHNNVFEVFAGYSYLRTTILSPRNFNGGSGSIAVYLTPWVAIEGDLGGYHHSETGFNATAITFMGGPKFAYRKFERVTPFGHFLLGGMHMSTNNSDLLGATSFAFMGGGGFDVKLTPHVGFRVAQVDYVYTNFNGEAIAGPQNGVRISTGVVFGWGQQK